MADSSSAIHAEANIEFLSVDPYDLKSRRSTSRLTLDTFDDCNPVHHHVFPPPRKKALMTKVKSNLRGWKELIVYLHSIFIWTNPQDAPLLTGIVTGLFLLIWILNTSLLTTISVIGILITVSDYAVPLLCTNLFDPTKWTQKEEKIYEEVCSEVALGWFTINSFWSQWQDLKETKPKMYSIMLLGTLIILAWIGNLINNLLLAYLITLFAILFPGLKHHGIIQAYVAKAASFVKNQITSKLNTASAPAAKPKTN